MVEQSRLKVHSRILFESLEQYCDDRGSLSSSYWPSYPELQEQFADSQLTPWLQQMLVPQPSEFIVYDKVQTDSTLDVDTIDNLVDKSVEKTEHLFLVVAVSTHESPRIVHRNMIYFADSSEQFRLLASVDFAQHGRANPGH